MPLQPGGVYEAIPYGHAVLPITKGGSLGITISWHVVKACEGTPELGDEIISVNQDVYVTGKRRQRLMGWDQLVDVLGWSGKFADVVDGGTWKPAHGLNGETRKARITIIEDFYNNKRQLKVDSIGHLDGRSVRRSGVGAKEAQLYDAMIEEGPISEAEAQAKAAEPVPVEDGDLSEIPF